jgi:Cu-Zn family superoxide dismutase
MPAKVKVARRRRPLPVDPTLPARAAPKRQPDQSKLSSAAKSPPLICQQRQIFGVQVQAPIGAVRHLTQRKKFMRSTLLTASVCAAFLMSGAPLAHAASATLKNPEGAEVGTVTLTEVPSGVLLDVSLHDLPAGVHAFHIHQTGSCSPDFGASGGHFAGGDKQHGLKVDGGPHAGDMPNIHVPESGALEIEVLNTAITFHDGAGALFDDDGSAIVIHDHADDYQSQPTGDAGGRIACGVITE